jgi:PKD repeat protein
LNGALAYTWDFGDGTLSGNQTATHTYTAVGTYTVKLTVISSNCVNTQTTTVTISVDAGIQENNESFGFNVFPNPFNSNTSIKLKIYRETELGMEIFNSIGQKVKTISDKKTYQEGEYNYSTDFLAKGIYFLKVNFKEKTYIYKLISIE